MVIARVWSGRRGIPVDVVTAWWKRTDIVLKTGSTFSRPWYACNTIIKFVLRSSYVGSTPPVPSAIRPKCALTAPSFRHARSTLVLNMLKIWPRAPRSWWLHHARSWSQYVHKRSNCGSATFYTLPPRSTSVVWA